MTHYFRDHRAQFTQLIKLLNADPRIVYMNRMYDINSGKYIGTKIADASDRQVSGQRAQQVLDLWRELNLKYICFFDGEFMIQGRASSDDAPDKAFLWAVSPPSPLVQKETTHVRPNPSVYRALGDDWYIVYSGLG